MLIYRQYDYRQQMPFYPLDSYLVLGQKLHDAAVIEKAASKLHPSRLPGYGRQTQWRHGGADQYCSGQPAALL